VFNFVRFHYALQHGQHHATSYSIETRIFWPLAAHNQPQKSLTNSQRNGNYRAANDKVTMSSNEQDQKQEASTVLLEDNVMPDNVS
jgi:hypothetical protein